MSLFLKIYYQELEGHRIINYCYKCLTPSVPRIDKALGSMIVVTSKCKNGHTRSWKSQTCDGTCHGAICSGLQELSSQGVILQELTFLSSTLEFNTYNWGPTIKCKVLRHPCSEWMLGKWAAFSTEITTREIYRSWQRCQVWSPRSFSQVWYLSFSGAQLWPLNLCRWFKLRLNFTLHIEYTIKKL